MVALLLGAAAVSLAIGEALDAGLILVIVVVNAVLGYLQEERAQASAAALRELVSESARVLRDSRAVEVAREEVVPGDVALLRAGDRMPADGHWVEADAVEVDEAPLTGESLPVAKRAGPPPADATPLAEQRTMGFAATTVMRGRGRLEVTATGASTEMGRIVAAAARRRERTPLQARLDRFAGTLIRLAIGVCVVVAAVAWLQGDDAGESLLIGVSLAVAAIPEGLPAVVTVVLAVGLQRMAERGAIVRRLPAVETLGSTTVICTDKTGTLTENRIQLERVEALNTAEGEALEAAVLASPPEPEGGSRDPIDAALLARAAEEGADPFVESGRVVRVIPFDAERRRVATIVEGADGSRSSYVKGAPEAVAPLLREDRERPLELAGAWAAQGLRVLLVARRQGIRDESDAECDLAPVALLGFSDPVREGVGASIEEAAGAGVRTVMVTGDHPRTAATVARACGIGGAQPNIVTGSELEELEPEARVERIANADVFARVEPTTKVLLVDSLKEHGEIVAMTGDGVNDVPALRAAHVAVAMGRRGTEAARSAADIVLTDDNYSTIVEAIRRGRTIGGNIVHFVQFLLAANAGEVLVFVAAVGAGLSAPLTVLQILVVNLLTDGLPAVALGLDPPSAGVMRRPPAPARESILARLGRPLLVVGLAVGAAALAAFLYGRAHGGQQLGQTMAFTTLVFAQLAYVFTARGNAPFWRAPKNRVLLIAVGVSVAIQAALLALPALGNPFGVVSMSAGQLALALGLALVPALASEIEKALRGVE